MHIDPCEACPKRQVNEWLNGPSSRVIEAAQQAMNAAAMSVQVALDSLPGPVWHAMLAMEQERQAAREKQTSGGRQS